MPKDQMGALTEESSTDEVPDPSPSEAPEAVTLSSQQVEEEQQTPRQSHPEVSSNATGLSQSQPSTQRHTIKNTDEIFQTMNELMKKLHRLRVNAAKRMPGVVSFLHSFFFYESLYICCPPLQEIEADHYRLVKTEKKKSPLGQNSDGGTHTSASAVRMPSMDRGAGDGEWVKG